MNFLASCPGFIVSSSVCAPRNASVSPPVVRAPLIARTGAPPPCYSEAEAASARWWCRPRGRAPLIWREGSLAARTRAHARAHAGLPLLTVGRGLPDRPFFHRDLAAVVDLPSTPRASSCSLR